MYMRSIETQSCPADVKQPRMATSRKVSRLASAQTIIGFFPPSSSDAPISLAPAWAATIFPVLVDPVKHT